VIELIIVLLVTIVPSFLMFALFVKKVIEPIWIEQAKEEEYYNRLRKKHRRERVEEEKGEN
jgi:hypothetical protein